MKEDEKYLLKIIQENDSQIMTARGIVKNIGMNPKRANYIFGKWHRRGWYEFGVAIDLGWMTEKGKQEAINV